MLSVYAKSEKSRCSDTISSDLINMVIRDSESFFLQTETTTKINSQNMEMKSSLGIHYE